MPRRRAALPRRGDAGFSLVESLVALAVLAIASTALLVASQGYVRRIVGLEDRALAQIAAENALAELQLGLPLEAEPAPLLGRRFGIEARAAPTDDPDLERIEIVATDLDTGARHAGFLGFFGTEGAR